MIRLRHIAVAGFVTLAAGSAFAAGVPQIEQKDSYPGQLVWLAISFVMLYLIVSRFIMPAVSGVLETRDRAITDAIAKAEELKTAAAGTRGDFEATATRAKGEAAALLAQAQADAAQEAAAAQATLAGELEAKAQAARREIDAAMEKAQSGLEDAAVSLATAMVEKLIGAMPDGASSPAPRQARKA